MMNFVSWKEDVTQITYRDKLVLHSVSGCTCADGKVLYDGECIAERKCPCYDEEGNVVLPGFETSPGPCETWYVCNL